MFVPIKSGLARTLWATVATECRLGPALPLSQVKAVHPKALHVLPLSEGTDISLEAYIRLWTEDLGCKPKNLETKFEEFSKDGTTLSLPYYIMLTAALIRPSVEKLGQGMASTFTGQSLDCDLVAPFRAPPVLCVLMTKAVDLSCSPRGAPLTE